MSIVGAAYRYYRSSCEQESAKRRGKEEQAKRKRRRERLTRVSS